MALTLSAEDYNRLHRLMTHMATCRTCTKNNGLVAGLRGCAAGHQLAVRGALVIRAAMRSGGILPEGDGSVR